MRRMELFTHPTLDQLHQLGLAGMARAFAELEANPTSAALSHAEWLGTPRSTAISSARRPSSVSRIARARSASPRCSDFDRARNAVCSPASAVSFDFPGMLALHSPHPRKTLHPSPILMQAA